jgi:hypothetical protein
MICGYSFHGFVCAVVSDAQVKVKVKEKQPCTGADGSRRLRLPDFKTFGT